jgi:hypothetical protein
MSAEPENRFNFTGALMAKMLEEADFPVNAAGLKWETYLSLAWTEWRFLGLSFAWTRHTHPRPDQLLHQTRAWGEFIEKLIEPKNRLEMCAYAWIYHQRQFSDDTVDKAMDPLKLLAPDTSLPWDRLLTFADRHGETPNRWLDSTLPLLARPELGFPPEVQELLLNLIDRSPEKETIKRDLKDQRRRLPLCQHD